MNDKILVGVSGCLTGEKVRFDGGHKINRFITEELADYFRFISICPEVGIGLPVPRPAIRLGKSGDQIRLIETKNPANDHTQALLRFSRRQVEELKEQPVCGYVVCAKSPTCGMERVKIYQQDRADKQGVGLYTQQLMEQMPWLPVEEDGRLNDPVLRENFIARVFALSDLYHSLGEQPDSDQFIRFHSRYKLTLMAHHQGSYRELGKLVANIKQYDPDEFYLIYRAKFMQILKLRASRKNNTNVLMHLQGYFKRVLNASQKAELSKLIDDYRVGHLPLLVPLTLIKHYLFMFPDAYLQQQHFLNPYPQELCLRYGL